MSELWGVMGAAGLVVYQVSNTEANELPERRGLASRQRSVACIRIDRHYRRRRPTHSSPPLCFLSSLPICPSDLSDPTSIHRGWDSVSPFLPPYCYQSS